MAASSRLRTQQLSSLPALPAKRALLRLKVRGLRTICVVIAVLVAAAPPVLAGTQAQSGNVNSPAASPGLLYGVNAAGELIAIDPAGSSERRVGPIGVPEVSALAYDDRSDTLYGLTGDGKLLTIDRRTGRGRVVQTISVPGRPLFSSLAFEPAAARGRLYAANAAEGLEFLRIDLGRVPPHPVVRLGSTQDGGVPAQVTGLAFQPGTGRLYAVERNRNALGMLAAASGAFATVFPNCGINNPEGLAFDPGTGALYGVFSPGTLGVYDLATGLATAVGRTTSVSALAFAPPPLVPLAQSSNFPYPGENLKTYKARMEAYFAPQIARRGLDALVAEEGGRYNEYVNFLREWEPRLSSLDGDFAAYFQLVNNYYKHYHGGGASAAGAAAAQREKEPTPSTAAGILASSNTGPWQEVGPISKPTSNVGGEGTGPIEFITFFGPAPSHMLCGSIAGGLFYSTNGGLTWSSDTGTDTQIGRSGVGIAVFHPGDYKTWFAASAGDSGSNEPAAIGYIGGVFRTTDEGATWSQIGTQGDLGGIWSEIFRLAINPANASQLWAATSTGLYVTNNALAPHPAWTAVTDHSGAVTDLSGKYVYDFKIRPGDANWLYATAATSSGGNLTDWHYLYSNDNGITWHDVPGQPASTSGAYRLTIEVTPAKADNLYGLTIPPGGYSSELYIYDFGSQSWHLVDDTVYTFMGAGHAFGVSAIDPNEIFIADDTSGRRYNYLGNPLFITYDNTYSADGTYHPDLEALVPHPVNGAEVWMGHHGGVSVSTDHGLTWTDRSTGIGAAHVFRMAAAASNPGYVALGLYHDGTIVTTSPWYDLWSPGWKQFQCAFCDGMLPMIDPTAPLYMWHSCQVGNWHRSSDTGSTFHGNPPDSAVWVVDAAFDNSNPTIQYRLSTDAGGHHTVVRTFDRGDTWTQIAAFEALYPAATYDYILWKVYTPETKQGEGYLLVHLMEKPAGSKNWWTHHLYRTKTANAADAATVISSWQELPLPADSWMSAVRFDPVNPDIVYIANSSSISQSNSLTGKGMVFKVDYTDPAAHTYNVCSAASGCSDLTQNLPNATAGGDALAVERGCNGGLYYASDFGLWYASDVTLASGSEGWTLLGGLPNTTYNGVIINYVNHKIRVGSSGRGLWEADLPVPTACGCIQPPSQLALWLPLDEAAGPTALNTVVPIPGTYAGGPTPTQAGKVDGALCFDGNEAHVDVPPYGAISFSAGNFSLDTWVLRRPGATGTEVLIDRRSDAQGPVVGYSLFLDDGQIGLQLADGTYANYLSQAQVPDDGLWHHVAATVDRGNPAGGWFYLDGQPAGPPFDPTAHRGSLNSPAPFRVGARSALSSSGAVSAVLQGCLDEVEAFRRVLSPSEVLSIYSAGKSGKCKVSCTLPQPASFCGQSSVIAVNAQVCNYRPAPQGFDFSFQGLPVQGGCSIPGPASFTPAAGTSTVPPGKCATIPTLIGRPAALTGTGQTGCYEMLVQAPATKEAFSCEGTVDVRSPFPYCWPLLRPVFGGDEN